MFAVGFYHYPERHLELIRLLGSEFGDIAFIRPWDNKTNAGDLTMRTLDQNDKQIIILYNDKNVIEGSFFLKKNNHKIFISSNQTHQMQKKKLISILFERLKIYSTVSTQLSV